MSSNSPPQSKLLLDAALHYKRVSAQHPVLDIAGETYESVAANPVAELSEKYLFHSGIGRITVNAFDTLGNFIINVATYFLGTFIALIVTSIVHKYNLTDYDYFVAFVIACVVVMSIVLMVVTFKKCLEEKMGGDMNIVETTEFDKLRKKLLQEGLKGTR